MTPRKHVPKIMASMMSHGFFPLRYGMVFELLSIRIHSRGNS